MRDLFRLRENRTDVRTEVIAGATTFVTLSYILFVQPTVLSACGMNFGSVLTATRESRRTSKAWRASRKGAAPGLPIWSQAF
jgi:xanthine/uracil/vitamin C permease (AzgA family)